MKKKLILAFCAFVAGLAVPSLKANLDGTSSVVVDTTNPYDFDTTTTNDSATGFVWLRTGFKATVNTTLTIVAPVGGNINLNSNTVTLGDDLSLDSGATFVTAGGSIDAAGHAIHLGGKLSLTQALTFTGSTIIDGHGNQLDLNGGSITVASGQTVRFRNVIITGLSSTSLANAAASSTIILENSSLIMDGNTSFTTGKLQIEGECALSGTGAYTFTNSSSAVGALTINAASSLTVEKNTTYHHSYHLVPATGDGVSFTSAHSVLAAIGGTLDFSRVSGENLGTDKIALKTGMLWIDHTSTVVGDVTIGDGSNPIALELLPGASLNLDSGTITYANTDS